MRTFSSQRLLSLLLLIHTLSDCGISQEQTIELAKDGVPIARETIKEVLGTLASRLKANRESICFWQGDCKIHSDQDDLNESADISFFIDRYRAREAYLATFPNASKSPPSTVHVGRIVDEKEVCRFDSVASPMGMPLITVGYPGAESGSLHPANFSPMMFFRVVDQDSDDFFMHLQQSLATDWLRIELVRKGKYLFLTFGNNGITVADTELVFDESRSCVLVSMFNPGPNDESRLQIEYEEFEGVWLPVMHQATRTSPESKSSVRIEISNQQINTPIDSSKFTPEGLFPISSGDRLLDQRTRAIRMFSEKLQLMQFQEQSIAEQNQIRNSSQDVKRKTFLFKFSVVAIATLLVSFLITTLVAASNAKSKPLGTHRVVIVSAISFVVVLLAFACYQRFSAYAKQTGPMAERFDNPQCAHFCINRICAMLGIEIGLEKIMQELPPHHGLGNSVTQIRSFFDKLGLKTSFYPCEYSTLEKIDAPCIVHLKNPNHFVLVARSDVTNELYALDGIQPRQLLELDEIARRWGDGLLTIYPNLESGNAVTARPRFSKLSSEVGMLPMNQAERVVGRYEFKNTTAAPIQIKKVIEDCDCLESLYPKGPLAPGETQTIELSFAPLKRSSSTGNFEHSAHVVFDGEGLGAVRVHLAGSIAIPLSSTSKVANFGTKRLSTNASVVSADTTIPVLLPGRRFDQVFWRVESDQLSDLTVEVAKDPILPSAGVLKITTRTPLSKFGQKGQTVGTLRVFADQSQLSLPIRLIVRPEREVFPKTLRGEDSKPTRCWIYSDSKDIVVKRATADSKDIEFRMDTIPSETLKCVKVTIGPGSLTNGTSLDLELLDEGIEKNVLRLNTVQN